MTTIGIAAVTEDGIHIPARWFRKEITIGWDGVHKIAIASGSVRIYYQLSNGRYKSVSISLFSDIFEDKKIIRDYEKLMEFWENMSLKKIKDQGFLEGISTGYLNWQKALTSSYIGFTIIAICVVFIFVIRYTPLFIKLDSNSWWYYRIFLIKHSGFWLFILLLFFFTLFNLFSLYKSLSRLNTFKRWKNWRISKDNFSIKNESGIWEPFLFDIHDSINTMGAIIINGKYFSCTDFTFNPVMPFLLSIVYHENVKIPSYPGGKKRMIIPMISVISFLMLIFFPDCDSAQLKICFMVYVFLIFLCSITFLITIAILISTYHVYQSRINFGQFMDQVDNYRACLGW